MMLKHKEFEPPEVLCDSIKCFWHNCRELGAEESNFEVVPDGYAEIVFYFGSGCSILRDGVLQQLLSPFIIGLLNQPVVFFAKNRLEIIGVRCYPWTVFDLLGVPSGKDGIRVIDHPICALQSILNGSIRSKNIDEAINTVTQFFLSVRSQVVRDSLLYKAGVALLKANGSMPVNQIASAAHATVRTLERKFKQSSGHTLKDVSALMRFEQVRNQLWINPDSIIAGIAQQFGYTDQSHLTKEFKRFSGITPGSFARKAKRSKKLVSNNFVAFVQS